MNRSRRLSGYGLVLLVLLGILAVGPRAWATPEQSYPSQNMTVPTPTPVVDWSPTPRPTDRPPATDVPPTNPPEATSPASPTRAPSATPLPDLAPVTTVTDQPTSGAVLMLAKEVAHREAWPGATVSYTLTLTNIGSASARQIILEDTLPADLEAGDVQGTTAAWDGRTLRARAPVLPPGGRLIVAFNAVVAANVLPGGLLVNQAQASAAGGLSASAEVGVALPPVELPVVGGALGICGAYQ